MPTEAAPLRRKPVQQRSAQRVEKMLESCAQLIDEVGYEGLTTTLIAERAGVAVGSLYQFFPDKRAVVQELTLRNMDRFVQTVSERFDHSEMTNWWEAVDAVFEIYMTMHREIPGFNRLHFGDVVDLRLLDESKDNNAVLAEKLVNVLSDRFGLATEDLHKPLAVAVEAADAVLRLAFRRDPTGDPGYVAEARELVQGYLANRIPGPHPKDLPSPR
ncbi:AcrR family transcriptional regulator [Saccharopolyspora lacisalsi]|uniref:AcrR family transcriptional regulator n=1 Tax=Halosaccharopolyspora lacisalsi TaxID=1000566 RepID=A0A839E4T2_9PSEU|nr:AcrR family transcriptional regulator [Halosaccharopolyspora lacisalsi]